MARVGEITVEGLGAGRKIIRKELQSDVNVFFGKNGGGKTTLLRTIHSALRNDASIISESTVLSASIEIESLTYGQTFTRILTLSNQKTPSSQLSFDVAAVPEPDVKLSKRPQSIWQIKGDLEQPDAAFNSLYLSVSRLYSEALRQTSRNLLINYPASSAVQEDPAAREPSLEATFVANFNRKWSIYANRLLADIKRIQQNVTCPHFLNHS